MSINDLIAAKMASRKASALLVSTDRETPELTASLGRFTYYAATMAQRDAFIARETAAGRNPRVEA